ncbi:MAG: hypothetical protein ABH875_05125 [Candidatus Omnitrophota bacterium]
MMNIFIRVSLVFAAGVFGASLNRIVAWLFGITGISSSLGVNFAPPLSEGFIYSGLVWGGIWGLIFLLPYLKKNFVLRGTVYGIAPSLVMLIVVFPFWFNCGMMGLKLGKLMPLLVFIFNTVWGVGAAWWLKLAGEDKA